MGVELLGAFAAGLLSFLSPCVLPLVPSYLSYLTGMTAAQEIQARRHLALLHALFFVLGFTLIFVALGATATALGRVLNYYQHWLERLGGALIVFFGLVTLGVVRIGALTREARVQLQDKPVGFLGSSLAGMAFGAGWTPCIGPVLATILLYAGTTATVGQGALLLGIYALGLGVPFFVAAVAFNGFLTRAPALRRWLVPIERAAGAVLVVLGVLLFSGRFAVLAGFFARWS